MSRFKEEILNSQVYLINLDKSTDRFEEAFININVAGFNNIERYSAVDADELKKKNQLEAEWAKHGSPEFSKIAPPIISIDYKIGRHGCMLSHLNLWKKIIEMPDIKDDTKFVIGTPYVTTDVSGSIFTEYNGIYYTSNGGTNWNLLQSCSLSGETLDFNNIDSSGNKLLFVDAGISQDGQYMAALTTPRYQD
jgi:hypothetical protein